jgi:hypothetical protein
MGLLKLSKEVNQIVPEDLETVLLTVDLFRLDDESSPSQSEQFG